MTYIQFLTVCVVTGVVGSGFLLAFWSEILWYVKRQAGSAGVLIIEAAYITIGWMFLFGLLLLGSWHAGIPEDTRVAFAFLGVGFALGPWIILLRWLRWRFGKDD